MSLQLFRQSLPLALLTLQVFFLSCRANPSTAALRGSIAQGAHSGAAVDSAVVLVGSVGCDPDDVGCTPGEPTAERILKAVEVRSGGEMALLPGLAVDVGDLPLWVTTANSSSGGECIFVSRGERNDLLALLVGPNMQLQPPGSTVYSGGQIPVYSAVTGSGNFLLGANYGASNKDDSNDGASVASFGIEADCHLRSISSVAHHGGSQVVPWRQGAAHVHSIEPARGGLAYACDLGMDIVITYAVASGGALEERSRVQTAPGCGPRHAVQHPSDPLVYVVCELSQDVLTYSQGGGGELTLQQTSSLLPRGTTSGGSKAAEIVILSDGSAIYVSNRGARNTVTAFALGADGLLSWLQEVAAPAFPRGMTLALGGSLLLVAGQSASELVSFRIGPGGQLESTGHHLTEGLPPHPAALAVLGAEGRGPSASPEGDLLITQLYELLLQQARVLSLQPAKASTDKCEQYGLA
eukprot:CAMPEP_0115586788 /NCGR_PEP_ID=MMETSP0272-20121206/7876_1 /TAXON_ID=71861 /ORGANISM="Scrippsiella trochoidea, Strain CCMP3099" /LENGTH=466 /DNA_ID=CAMNT_0003021857 /DNA_START=38 /DNA_END=1435 /DNA_ORIENTATION=+